MFKCHDRFLRCSVVSTCIVSRSLKPPIRVKKNDTSSEAVKPLKHPVLKSHPADVSYHIFHLLWGQADNHCGLMHKHHRSWGWFGMMNPNPTSPVMDNARWVSMKKIQIYPDLSRFIQIYPDLCMLKHVETLGPVNLSFTAEIPEHVEKTPQTPDIHPSSSRRRRRGLPGDICCVLKLLHDWLVVWTPPQPEKYELKSLGMIIATPYEWENAKNGHQTTNQTIVMPYISWHGHVKIGDWWSFQEGTAVPFKRFDQGLCQETHQIFGPKSWIRRLQGFSKEYVWLRCEFPRNFDTFHRLKIDT